MGKLSYLYVLAGFLFVCPTAGAQEPEEINIKKELMITDLSVVNDARAEGPDGPWSFGGLMTRMAPSDAAGPQFVKDWLDTWRKGGSVNSFELDKREAIDAKVIGPWMEKDRESSFENWKPNLANASFRLLAVVYRPDLVKENEGGDFENAGEGRFVFAALDKVGNALPFTVIFEYGLVGTDRADVKAWAERWHALGRSNLGPSITRLCSSSPICSAAGTAIRGSRMETRLISSGPTRLPYAGPGSCANSISRERENSRM
jgi:hypothetical protein